MFPSNDSVIRPPASLHRVPRFGSPASSVLPGGSDSPPSPFRFVSFAWRLQPSSVTDGGASQVPARPSLHVRPALRPRRDLRARPFRRVGTAPGWVHSKGSRNQSSFEARSHGFRARCLRFAATVTRDHARLASGWRPAFTGRGSNPLGLFRRFQVCRLQPFLLRQAYPGAQTRRTGFPTTEARSPRIRRPCGTFSSPCSSRPRRSRRRGRSASKPSWPLMRRRTRRPT